MKPKLIAKLSCDVLMTAALLLLMAYEMIGEAAHEWIGIGMFLLLLGHHVLNKRWSIHLFKGKYSGFRIFQTVIVALLILCMLGLGYSSVVLSRHVFSFLSIEGGRSLARILHMLCAYWSFVLLGVHLGVHWNMVMGILGRGKKKSPRRRILLHILAAVAAVYGLYAFHTRQIGMYMLLRSHFVFFDYEEPLALFLLDYVAVMGFFAWIGYSLSWILKWVSRKRKSVCVKK